MSDKYEYVTLTSHDSRHLYPDNHMANFKTKLGWRMRRPGNWEVGLVRLSFTNTLCTFNEPQSVEIRERGDDYGLSILIAPQHFRTIDHLIRTINRTLKRDISVSEEDRLPTLGQDKHGRVYKFDGMINGKVHTLHISEGLELILGLKRSGFHHLTAFKNDVYVYIDCIKSSIVGDTTVQLLDIVDIGSEETDHGEQTIIKIKKPNYVPVSYSDITEIEVQLRDDTGKEIKFEYGLVSVTLHFREI